MIEETFDADKRAKEKQESRDQDEDNIKSGRKTLEQLRKENASFAFSTL